MRRSAMRTLDSVVPSCLLLESEQAATRRLPARLFQCASLSFLVETPGQLLPPVIAHQARGAAVPGRVTRETLNPANAGCRKGVGVLHCLGIDPCRREWREGRPPSLVREGEAGQRRGRGDDAPSPWGHWGLDSGTGRRHCSSMGRDFGPVKQTFPSFYFWPSSGQRPKTTVDGRLEIRVGTANGWRALVIDRKSVV